MTLEPMRARRLACLASVAVALAIPATADGSQLIGRNATGVRLGVSRDGAAALLTYRIGGRLRHVRAWGAVNARAPARRRSQVAFHLDYSAGPAAYSCGRYDGPPLHWLVVACKARDGSYWAAQRWQRRLPNYGVAPQRRQVAWELRLSHWRGALPAFLIRVDWAHRRYHHLYGVLAYLRKGVHGFRSTPRGSPLDTFGRNVYVDTHNSRYGPGWRHENSFLTHRPTGVFCYGFYPHGGRPSGMGDAYRATVIGPGVLPDLFWQGRAPGRYKRRLDLRANAEQRLLFGRDKLCRPN